MPISLMRENKNNAMHGTDNGRFTGCRMKISAAFTREGELKEITDLTCDRCKEVFATKMIRESNREDARLEKEERQRFKKAKKQGIVQEATYEEYIHNRETEASAKKAAHEKSLSMSLAELRSAVPQESVQSQQFQPNTSPVQPPFDPYAQQASPVQPPFDPYAQQASPVQPPFDPYAQQASPVQPPFDPYAQQASPVQPPFDPYAQQPVQSQPITSFGGNVSPVQSPFDPYAQQQTSAPQVPIFDPFTQQTTAVPQKENNNNDGPVPSYQSYTKGYDPSSTPEKTPAPAQASPLSASDDDFLAQFIIKKDTAAEQPTPMEQPSAQSVTVDSIRSATDDILSQFNITPPPSEPETPKIDNIKADAASFYSNNIPVVDSEYAVSLSIAPEQSTLDVPTSLADDFVVPDVPVYQPYTKDSFLDSSSLDEIKAPDISELRSAAENLKHFSRQFDELTSEDSINELSSASNRGDTVPELQPDIMHSDDIINSFDDTSSKPEVPTLGSFEPVTPEVPEVPTLSSFEPVTPAVPETPTLGSFEPVTPTVPETPTFGSFEPVTPAVPETPTFGSFEPVTPAVPETPTLGSFEPVTPAVPETPTLGSFEPVTPAVPETPTLGSFEPVTPAVLETPTLSSFEPVTPTAPKMPTLGSFEPITPPQPVQSQPAASFGGNVSPIQPPFDPYAQQQPVQSQPVTSFGGNVSPVQPPFDPYAQQQPVQSQPVTSFGGNVSPVQPPFDPYAQQQPVQSQPVTSFGGNVSPVQPPFDPYAQQQPVQPQAAPVYKNYESTPTVQPQAAPIYKNYESTPTVQPYDPYAQQATPIQPNPVVNGYGTQPSYSQPVNPYAQPNNFSQPQNSYQQMPAGNGVLSFNQQHNGFGVPPQAFGKAAPQQPPKSPAVIEPGNTADSIEEALRMFGIDTGTADNNQTSEKEEITPDFVPYVPSSSKVLHTAPPSNNVSNSPSKRPISAKEAKQLAKIDAKFKKDLQSRGFNPNEVRSQRRGK